MTLEVIKRTQYLIAAVILLFSLLLVIIPRQASAGQLTDRQLELSTSAGNTAATWTFTFDVDTTTALNGITFQPCTTASGSCTTPNSWTNSGASLGSISYNGSGQAGWTLDNAAGYLRIKNNSSVTAVTNPVVATFNTVTNPDTTNETFFVRILTYTGDDFTGQLDEGVVAASTAQQINVTASVAETLTFCTGTSGVTTSSCAGATGSTVALGELSPSTTEASTSQMGVGTNANGGYAITVNGATLTSGGNTIDAMTGSSNTSDIGTEEFGINLMDNATPDIGSDPDGSGTGAPTTDYGTADEFKFVSGETIAEKSSGADLFRRFTVSYIANINTATEAGSYSTTLTYICTPTF